ncbi:MAG: threonylcarbamoyl-AMP synthase [Ignavibacteria bacterium GWB2_35_6b]|nr:MAG: threonylcarbamoyl-AMP synthase [Ignavibacteria bacterium GWB2_35_6b]
MKIVSITDYKIVIEALLNSKVAVVPTDTVYGLAAMPTSKEAVKKIYRIKQRPDKFNLPIMVSKISELYDLGLDINHNALNLLQSPFVPGSITLVLGFADSPRPEWLDGRDEVAVRIPNNQFMLTILTGTGPLLVTSANKHNSQINMGLISDILRDLEGGPDLIVDAGTLSDTSSTIVNCRYDKIQVEREGQVSIEQLQRYFHYE